MRHQGAPRRSKLNAAGCRLIDPSGSERYFHSRAEAAHVIGLWKREARGEITSLELQVRLILRSRGGVKLGCYVADARFVVVATGEDVIEDVKGFEPAFNKWKRIHAQHDHGVIVRLVRPMKTSDVNLAIAAYTLRNPAQEAAA